MEAVISTQPLPVHLLDCTATDVQALGQSPLDHSLRALHPNVLPFPFGQAPVSAREPALGPRFGLPRDRAVPLIGFPHHSLKASTLESWSRPLAVVVSKSSDRDRNSIRTLCRSSITRNSQVSPVSGGGCKRRRL